MRSPMRRSPPEPRPTAAAGQWPRLATTRPHAGVAHAGCLLEADSAGDQEAGSGSPDAAVAQALAAATPVEVRSAASPTPPKPRSRSCEPVAETVRAVELVLEPLPPAESEAARFSAADGEARRGPAESEAARFSAADGEARRGPAESEAARFSAVDGEAVRGLAAAAPVTPVVPKQADRRADARAGRHRRAVPVARDAGVARRSGDGNAGDGAAGAGGECETCSRRRSSTIRRRPGSASTPPRPKC